VTPPAPLWKVSRYFTRVDLDEIDTLLLYGGLAGSLIEITRDARAEVESLLANPNGPSAAAGTPIHRLLVDAAILVDEQSDERSLVARRREREQRPTGSMGLTICPTVNCNYRCVYCYQKHVGKLMPDTVQDLLLAFIDRQDPPVERLFVTWFGGEPLLGLPVIERLTAQLRARLPGDRYAASMVSNGWLLTADTSARVADLGVGRIQITLDGPRDVHNTRRPLAGGQPTFDRILTNLRDADPRLRFSVRVNTDVRNVDQVSQIFDELDEAQLRGRVSLYFAPVMPYTEVCADTAGHCIVGQDWSQANAQLRLMALERGYGGPALPGAIGSVCIADNPRGWVVTPDGLFYKCWNDVTSPDRAVFDLVTDAQTTAMKAELDKWKNWSPFKLADCQECKSLPQCQSGCAHLAMTQPAPITHGHCTELKWNLPETLATFYLAEKQRRGAQELDQLLVASVPPDVWQAAASVAPAPAPPRRILPLRPVP
jgi:uncharacterized protein